VLETELEALREQIDELAHGAAPIAAWYRMRDHVSEVIVHGQLRVMALRREMIRKARSSTPNWSWFETHAGMHEVREQLDQLALLRMCVDSRIFELETHEVSAHAE